MVACRVGKSLVHEAMAGSSAMEKGEV